MEMNPQMLLIKGNAMSWCALKRDIPIARKRFPGLRDLSRGWECDVRKGHSQGEGTEWSSSAEGRSCCHLKKFNDLNNFFALGIFSVSAQKSSCITEKDTG